MNPEVKSKIDVLLAYPAETAMLHSSMIPLGIASIAAVLENNGFRVEVIDFNYYKGSFHHDLLTWLPGIVGIGGTTPTRKGSFDIARNVKRFLPHVPVVYGGVHATFAAKDTLMNVPEIDYILKGEGEFTFLDLSRKFVREDKITIETIPGLCYRSDNVIIENKPERIKDLSVLPLPARHLFDNDYRIKLDFSNVDAEMIITARGCPITCTFCSASRMFPGGVTLQPVNSIKKEIDYLLKQKDIKGLKIFNSTFTADREHVMQFCSMIKPYGLQWECEIRVDSVDYELLKTMKDAGCYYVDVGMETTNEVLLSRLNKRITVQQAEQVLEWCKKLDIKTKVFFIFGLLDETFEECLNDVKWLKKNRENIAFFANTFGLRIYPGTILEKQIRDKELIPEDFSWAKFKPPIKNLLLFESQDTIVLFQKQLSLMKIIIIGLLLYFQRTNLNPKSIMKLVKNIFVTPLNYLKTLVK